MREKLDIAGLQSGRIAPSVAPTPARPATRLGGTSFAVVLKAAQSGKPNALKFSAHASTRIESRQIEVGPAELQRVEGAVQKAAAKGSRDALVLLDQAAFVVSVANRTVITVVDKDNLKENVFTNIDSAIIA